MSRPTRVVFVCLGNICRSPTAEGVLRHLAEQEGRGDDVEVDSAGTSDYHIGEPADPRAQQEAARRGIDLSGLRGRQAGVEDFARYDLLVAMDAANEDGLLRLAPSVADREKVRLLRSFDPEADGTDVPDPYAGGPDGFVQVFDQVEAACRGLLAQLPRRGATDGR